MKPAFALLSRNYPGTQLREDLFQEIGWADVIAHPAFKDTCAIRMSLGLAASGILIHGNMTAKAGTLKGKAIETGQGRLSATLRRMWGAPEVYRGQEAAVAGIGRRSGVVSFFRIRTASGQSNGGHIDLVYPTPKGALTCARSCHFTAAEVWFWQLK
jgi:hypothetical protein